MRAILLSLSRQSDCCAGGLGNEGEALLVLTEQLEMLEDDVGMIHVHESALAISSLSRLGAVMASWSWQ